MASVVAGRRLQTAARPVYEAVESAGERSSAEEWSDILIGVIQTVCVGHASGCERTMSAEGEDTRTRDLLRTLILDGDISAIEILSKRTGRAEEEVVAILEDMVATGEIDGYLTPDRRRFFRRDVTPPEGTVGKDEYVPEFLAYETRLWRAVALVGLVIVIAGASAVWVFSEDVQAQNVSTLLLTTGLVIMIVGCYQIGRRPAPP